MSRRVTAITRSAGYLHHRLPVMGAIITDNAITYKAQRDKMPEN